MGKVAFHRLLALVWPDPATLSQQLINSQVNADHVPDSVTEVLCFLLKKHLILSKQGQEAL